MRGNTEQLAVLLRPVTEAIHPPESMKRKRRTDAALQDDGRVSPYALSGAIHHAAQWFVSGTRSVADNIGMEYRVPADGRLERFDVRLKTAPSGADFKCRLNRNGIAIGTATIAAGATTGGIALNEACNAGDILTIDVTQVGSGTAGANLSAACTHREERGM
jgi:hypothetical protein